MNSICITCGTQFEEAERPPDHCRICQDERQFVGLDGQRWTSLDELRTSHKVRIELQERGLTSFVTEPHFAIGQRAFLVQTSEGNVLWDCISLLDDSIIDHVKHRGGLTCICISHPHYYTTMVEWSKAFGGIPIYLHQDDSEWICRHDSAISFWQGDTKPLIGGLTLIRCGGHFSGATVLHWPSSSDNRGALLTADTIQVVPDRRHVSFMRSYPNYLPLSGAEVNRITSAVANFRSTGSMAPFLNSPSQQTPKISFVNPPTDYTHAISSTTV